MFTITFRITGSTPVVIDANGGENLLEVARVVKGLTFREHERGLSTGERKMLHTAKQILISELVLAQSLPYETVEERVDRILAH